MQSASGVQAPWLVLVVIYIAFAAACFIAWFNHKQGKGDKRGALALALLYFICCAAGRYLATSHSTTSQEIDTFWRVVAVAGINAGLAWILYLALEPWVRRRWPHTMIGWTRYVAKGIRDPLVGRDLLIGSRRRSPVCRRHLHSTSVPWRQRRSQHTCLRSPHRDPPQCVSALAVDMQQHLHFPFSLLRVLRAARAVA